MKQLNTTVFAMLLLGMLTACERGATPSADAPAASADAQTQTQEQTDAETRRIPEGAPVAEAVQPPISAVAQLAPTEGNQVEGVITFQATEAGLRLIGTVSGLKPGSTHGFHIHENGDCSAPDASSAGGHFSPENHEHGQPSSETSHAGDLPNLSASSEGQAIVEIMSKELELGTGTAFDVMGRALVVHADADDFSTQPSGASGARVACGVITAN